MADEVNVGNLVVKLVGDATDLAKTTQQSATAMDTVTKAADAAQAQINRLTAANKQLAQAQAQVITASKAAATAVAAASGGGGSPNPWTTGVSTGGRTGGVGFMTSFLNTATVSNAAAVARAAARQAEDDARLAGIHRARAERELEAIDTLAEMENGPGGMPGRKRGGGGGGGGHGHGFLSGRGAWLRAPLRMMDREMGIGLESMAMSMSGGLGLIAGLGTAFIATEALTRAYDGMRQRIAALNEKQREWNAQLRDTAVTSRDAALASGVANNAMSDGINRAADAEREMFRIRDEESKRQQGEADSPISMWMQNSMEHLASGDLNSTGTSSGRMHKLAQSQEAFYADQTARENRYADRNYAIQLRRNEMDRRAAVEAANIAAMAVTPQQKRMALENQLGTEARKLNEQNADRLNAQMHDAAQQRRVNAERVAAAKSALANLQAVPWILQSAGHDVKVSEAKRNLSEALDAQSEFESRFNGRRTALLGDVAGSHDAQMEEHAAKRRALARDIAADQFHANEEVYNATNRMDAAQITFRTLGAVREMELLKQRHRAEHDARQREMEFIVAHGGAHLTEKVRANAAADTAAQLEEQTAQKQQQIDYDHTIAQMTDATAVALRKITPAQAEWNAKARELGITYAGMPEKLAALKTAFDSMAAAQADRAVADQIYNTDLELQRLKGSIDMVTEAYLQMRRAAPDANPALQMRAAQQQQQLRDANFARGTKETAIDLAVARREMTDLQATAARLRLQNPGVSENEIQRRAAMERSVASANFAHNEMSRIKPMMQVADYKRQLDEAVKLHQLSQKDADKLLAQKAYETMGHFDVGEFGSQWRRGQVNLRGVNLNPQMNQFEHLVKQTDFLEAIKTNTGVMANKQELH